MDDELRKLTTTLRDESCPVDVLHRVNNRSAHENSGATGGFRLAGAVALCAMIVILVTILRDETPAPDVAAQSRADERTVRELQASLTVVGCSLLDAGEHTRSLLSEKLKPRLARGLEHATKTLLEKL